MTCFGSPVSLQYLKEWVPSMWCPINNNRNPTSSRHTKQISYGLCFFSDWNTEQRIRSSQNFSHRREWVYEKRIESIFRSGWLRLMRYNGNFNINIFSLTKALCFLSHRGRHNIKRLDATKYIKGFECVCVCV